MSTPRTSAADDATKLERADIEAVESAAVIRHQPAIRALGTLGELADQPQLFAICAGTLALALVRRDRRLTRAGARMVGAHLLATGAKMVVKTLVDRTRPHLLVDEGRYELKRGEHDEGPMNSFPSGHTAGAVAVARAYAREYPRHATFAYGAASVVAAIQIPRCRHYPTDVAAGAAIGLASEALVDRAAHALLPRAEPSARDIRIS